MLGRTPRERGPVIVLDERVNGSSGLLLKSVIRVRNLVARAALLEAGGILDEERMAGSPSGEVVVWDAVEATVVISV